PVSLLQTIRRYGLCNCPAAVHESIAHALLSAAHRERHARREATVPAALIGLDELEANGVSPEEVNASRGGSGPGPWLLSPRLKPRFRALLEPYGFEDRKSVV